MPHAGEVGAERRAADLVERRRLSARAAVAATTGSSAASSALTIGLAERNEPHAGRNQVRRHGMQIGLQRRLQPRCRGRPPSRRPRSDTRPARPRLAPACRAPRRAMRRASPRRRRVPCAVVSRWRSFDGANAAASSATSRKAAVVAAATPRDAHARRTPHRRNRRLRVSDDASASACSVCRILDVAGLDRPLDAAGIRECADRIGRRQPRHQPVERRWFTFTPLMPAKAGIRFFGQSAGSPLEPVFGRAAQGPARRRGRAATGLSHVGDDGRRPAPRAPDRTALRTRVTCAPRPFTISSSTWSRRMRKLLSDELHIGVPVADVPRKAHEIERRIRR